MAKVELGTAHTGEYWTVLVDAGELICDGGKPLPYPTWIGTFKRDGTINVWTPAAGKPRGYKTAATRLLRNTADGFLAAQR